MTIKLSIEQVVDILDRLQEKEKPLSIACRYGVTLGAIAGIIHGKSWKGVTRNRVNFVMVN